MTFSLRSRIFRIVVSAGCCALLAATVESIPVLAQSNAAPPPGNAAAPANDPSAASAASDTEYIVIPGPLRSFLRMASTSQEASPEEILPLLGHFVETYGFTGSKEHDPHATEALQIFRRYFVEANTLASLAGPEQALHFDTCDHARPLISDLGYKLVNGCDKAPALEVDDAERAFVTVDSGFPLADMEDALRQGKPFSTPYVSTRVPLIYAKQDWTGKATSMDIEVVSALANNPALARLYWALSRLDSGTREALMKSGGMNKMVPLNSVLDFYGPSIAVRDGRVLVPGGPASEGAWTKLAGADPKSPGEFIYKLLQKDGGWLAEYYDAISRAPQAQLAYFTAGDHLSHFYASFHGNDNSDVPVRSIFRPGADLLLLVTRLPLDAQGKPEIPGNLPAWRDVFRRKGASKQEREIGRGADHMTADDFIAAMFAFARANGLDGTLNMYNTLASVDGNRTAGEKLSPETAHLLLAHYATLHDQYQIFAEFSGLNDASIAEFVRATDKINQIRDPILRGDEKGIFEANIGLWQIVARQGQISASDINESWRQTIEPFLSAPTSPQMYDAARASLAALMRAATGDPSFTQENLINLLAGPTQPTIDAKQVHDELANKIRTVLADQRLVSLDSLMELGDDLSKLGHTPNGIDAERAQNLAEELEEARSPRAMFTEAERAEWAPGHEPNQHVMLEMRTDLRKSMSGREPAAQATQMRGALTPFLRDTLVGINYAYYEPPGATVLHSSPLLVRAHDFLASESVGQNRSWQMPQLFGVGLTAGNGTHLSGSLEGLPYALAELEQDFIVPENAQALIWHDTAADLLVSSTVPRWWKTSQTSFHAAALYQKAGEELVTAAAKDATLRDEVMSILAPRLSAVFADQLGTQLSAGDSAAAIALLAPADTFYLSAEYRRRFPERSHFWGPNSTELEDLAKRDPSQADPEIISHDFGVPHPTLADSYTQQMLNLRPFPSLMDYASEMLSETWESTNLFWARLADEAGYTPVMLNELSPVLTRRMVEKIFGSDFDDWPALLRAERETAEDFRHGQVAGIPKIATMTLQP